MSSKSRWVLVVVLIAVVVVAFIVIKSKNDSSNNSNDKTSTTKTVGGQATTAVTKYLIKVKDGKPVGGTKDISVKSGDSVDFTVGSDTEGAVHVHGYNLMKMAMPGKPVHFNFKADKEGVFEVELHSEPEQKLARIKVNP